MPRTRRRPLSIAAALVAMLAAPTAAQAATYTIKAGDGGPCGGADLACGSLAEAAAAAAPGDVFNVAPGTYGSATFDDGGLTLVGTPNFTVDGTLTFSASTGGVSKLQKATIAQPTGPNPAVVVNGASGLQISDTIVLSANGDGASFAEGTANKIERSVIATGGQMTAAVRVTSADASSAKKQLTIDSTILSGGAAGLSVNTGSAGLLSSSAGAVDVILRHVTAAGSTNGIVLDASEAGALLGSAVGSITADVRDSIIQNGTAKRSNPGLLLVPANTVTETDTRTLRTFDANAVFVDPARRRYRLKAGSPAIDKGGVTPGESTTDVDGNDRATAPTDLGADEFTPPPPPPAPPVAPPTTPPAQTNDGTLPLVVITKPATNQRIRLTRTTTRTVTVTRNGRRTRVRRKTTKRTRIGFAGTASDKSGIKAVVLTVEKLAGSPPATAAPAAKCRYFNATKGIVLKTCTKPIVLLAKLRDGGWTYSVKSSIRLGAGKYRIVVAGADNSGAFGNAAPAKDAVHRFTLVK